MTTPSCSKASEWLCASELKGDYQNKLPHVNIQIDDGDHFSFQSLDEQE